MWDHIEWNHFEGPLHYIHWFEPLERDKELSLPKVLKSCECSSFTFRTFVFVINNRVQVGAHLQMTAGLCPGLPAMKKKIKSSYQRGLSCRVGEHPIQLALLLLALCRYYRWCYFLQSFLAAVAFGFWSQRIASGSELMAWLPGPVFS